MRKPEKTGGKRTDVDWPKYRILRTLVGRILWTYSSRIRGWSAKTEPAKVRGAETTHNKKNKKDSAKTNGHQEVGRDEWRNGKPTPAYVQFRNQVKKG